MTNNDRVVLRLIADRIKRDMSTRFVDGDPLADDIEKILVGHAGFTFYEEPTGIRYEERTD